MLVVPCQRQQQSVFLLEASVSFSAFPTGVSRPKVRLKIFASRSYLHHAQRQGAFPFRWSVSTLRLYPKVTGIDRRHHRHGQPHKLHDGALGV